MTSDTLNFSCALVTGGGGGIGKAIAKYPVSRGKTVLLAGRTEATGAIAEITSIVARVTRGHPRLDGHEAVRK